MNEQHPSEGLRQYGELFYRADAVAAILRAVAGPLEGHGRDFVLRVSSDLPTTMPWPADSRDLQRAASLHDLCRPVLLRLQHDGILGPDPLRLDVLLWRGPRVMPSDYGEHDPSLVDQQQNPL